MLNSILPHLKVMPSMLDPVYTISDSNKSDMFRSILPFRLHDDDDESDTTSMHT